MLIAPRGFCAGVDRAIKVVEECLELFGKPVYVKHQIVHNKYVVDALEKKGAITIEAINEIPDNAVVVFSAHGSPPEQYEQAKHKNLKLIDATCPLVTKVHFEVHRFAKQGYKIIYIGHHGHVEGIGVLGELPNDIPLVETIQDVQNLNIENPEKLIYLTQTTLSIDDTKKIVLALKQKYPQIRDPPKEDICYATTNRQHAIKQLAQKVDLVLVVGSTNSSNSIRLVETAKTKKPAYLVDDVNQIQEDWLENIQTVGISAGASAPESLVQEIAHYFTTKGATKEELTLMQEDVTFIDPVELRRAKTNATQEKH